MAPPAWLRDKRLWAFGGAGAGLGLLVYLQRRRSQATPVGPATGQAASPATFDDAGVGAYQNLQNEFESLQGNVSSMLGGLEGRLSTVEGALPDAQQAVAPRPTSKLAGPKLTAPALSGWHGTRITGRLTLRELAARYARAPGQPNSVEGTLRQIVAHNPWLTGSPAGLRVRQGGALGPGQIVVVPPRG